LSTHGSGYQEGMGEEVSQIRKGRLRRLANRVDAAQQRHPWSAVPAGVIRKFGDDRAGGLAALIAYYGFFSLFPLLLLVVTVTSYALHGNEQLQSRILDSALANLPIIGPQIRGGIRSIDGNVFAIVVGIAGALWGGMGVLAAVESAMDDVWDVPRRARASMLARLFRGVIVLVVFGTSVLLAALAASVSAMSNSLLASGIGWFIAAALNVGTMMLVFRVLTAAPLSWRDVWPGAMLAGLMWTALQALGGYIVGRRISGASDVYGVFAVVIGLLSWLYLGAQITMVSAELNVVLRKGLWPRSLTPPPHRPEDERAMRLQAQEETALPNERVSVEFRDRPSR
jgi:YihY family inner membrane protein